MYKKIKELDKKFGDYLTKGSKEMQMYKQLMVFFGALIGIYLGNLCLDSLMLSLEKNIMYDILSFIHITIIQTAYNILLLTTIFNAVLFGFKIFENEKVSKHLIIGHCINTFIILANIYIKI